MRRNTVLEKIVINDKEEALSLTLWRAVEKDACWSLNSRKGVCVCTDAMQKRVPDAIKYGWPDFQGPQCLHFALPSSTYLKPLPTPLTSHYAQQPHLFTLWSMMPLYPWRTGGWGLATLTGGSVGSCSCCRMRVSFASLDVPLKLPL